MSFVGGGPDCAVGSNAVAQFNKHTQQDRSLQRQVANPELLAQNSGFKQDNLMNQRERQHLEQFMGGSSSNAFQFQSMRHELNGIPQQLNGVPQQNSWGNEFQSHSPLPVLAQQRVGSPGQWAKDFPQEQRGGQNVSQQGIQQSGQFMNNQFSGNTQFSGRMGYRPMMGMSASMQAPMAAEQKVQNQQEQVDWDTQFKEVEELASASVEEAATAEDTASADFVIDDKYQATFQEVWDGLNSEAIESDFILSQYEDFKKTQGQTFPPDMEQWERDFSKYVSTRANFGEYKFEDGEFNQFSDAQDPYEIGLQLMENGAKLSEAALAFEAAIQRDQTHVDAWLKLGEVQTQNEKELAGISALEKCLELNPENSKAMMTLAISYINEGYDNAAFATLERWISSKYPQLLNQTKTHASTTPGAVEEDRQTLNIRVTQLFLQAAQLSPGQNSMDADVQMGLGVLFYANEDFDKTIDCFKAALTMRPDDPILWNRLGASLANSNRSEEAVDAYFKALELKPTFVRARYNLGVSCINIGCYQEAAEHLLSGLSMHQVEGETDTMLNHNQSTALTETLKRAFIAMDRRDLVESVRPGMDLLKFRGEFKF